MNTIILLAGLPGVGKSTISKLISRKIEAKILDLDDFKKTDVDPVLVKSQIDPPEVRWAYYRKAIECAFSIFEAGDASTVIIDEVFHLNQLREEFESLCIQMDIQVFWIEVQCPYALIEQRLNAHLRDGHILSTEEALRMNKIFDEIFEKFSANKRNHVTISNVGDVEMLVEGIIHSTIVFNGG